MVRLGGFRPEVQKPQDPTLASTLDVLSATVGCWKLHCGRAAPGGEQLKTPQRASSHPAPGAAPCSSARAFAARCLPPPGNPPASWLAPFASERGAEGIGPMGVGDSAGCGCQGRGPTSSILSSRAAASRGLDADATGRAGMEAARCAPGPRGDRSGGGGAGWGLHCGRSRAEARIQSPGWAGAVHTPELSRVALLEFTPNPLALLP